MFNRGRKSNKRAKRSPIPEMNYFIPEIGVSYVLIYFERYQAGIRVSYSIKDRIFTVKADSRISRKQIEAFMLSKSDLLLKWTKLDDNKTALPLPEGCKTAAFKNKLLNRCYDLLEKGGYDGPRPDEYKIGYGKSYWGRCTSDKVISISCYCYYLTDDQLYYILMHEHAHLTHMHHKPAFWNLVELYCPNYKNLRKELKSYSLK